MLSVEPKVQLGNRDDLSRAYPPGVARVGLAIAPNPADARHLTVERNTVAVVTDGIAVLGLGDIGPAAALPVMEGNAALFKRFAGVDAMPVCFDTKDTEGIISMVKAIAPLYGGVNLEDIAAPRCFEIGRRLRKELDIPVFHDDQHGTAIVELAALINAARVVEKAITDAHVLAFPGLFRDLLDAAARDITTPMLVAAAEAIANCVGADELDPSYIVPGVFDPRVAPRSPKQSSRRPVPDSTVPSTHRKACAL